MGKRISESNRKTLETEISLSLDLDGSGKSKVSTGVGFFDHMLTLLSFHSHIDLEIKGKGDLEVCDHHLVEDCGILLGKAIREALGDKKGIRRYGHAVIPMDEALVESTLDISGRSLLIFVGDFNREKVGDFSTEMAKECWGLFH